MKKPEDIPQAVWEAVQTEISAPGVHVHPNSYSIVLDRIARAIIAAKAEERQAIQALLAHGAPHSPRRYIYDVTADRRIWACDQLDTAIRNRGKDHP